MDNGCKQPAEKIIWDFDWADVPGATLYNLYVMGPSPNAKYPMINKNISTSKYHHESLGYVADFNRNNWTWKVRARVNGVWSNWSTRRSFNVEKMCSDVSQPATSPALISPRNGATMDNGCKQPGEKIIWDFDWADVPGATLYNLYVMGPSPNAKYPMIDRNISTSKYHHESLGYVADFNRNNWTWKVRARVNGVWSNWSTSRSFNVEKMCLDTSAEIEVTSPKADEEICLGKNMRISWKRTGIMDDRVKITLFRRQKKQYTISSSTANDGNFSWTIPVTVTPAGYRVIVRTLDGKVSGSTGHIRVLDCNK
jgi:hypothetical protein